MVLAVLRGPLRRQSRRPRRLSQCRRAACASSSRPPISPPPRRSSPRSPTRRCRADAVYFGEVSLSGAVRPVAQAAARLKEAAEARLCPRRASRRPRREAADPACPERGRQPGQPRRRHRRARRKNLAESPATARATRRRVTEPRRAAIHSPRMTRSTPKNRHKIKPLGRRRGPCLARSGQVSVGADRSRFARRPIAASQHGNAERSMPITWLDILLLGVMLISGLLAMIRGFMREILSITAWARGRGRDAAALPEAPADRQSQYFTTTSSRPAP